MVSSWTGIRGAIPNSGAVTMTLAPGFTCNYDSQIDVPTGTNVTIHGSGAVLDAAKQGRFFNVGYGATLALDHLVLQNGLVDDSVSA
jgi:hypothetical protein